MPIHPEAEALAVHHGLTIDVLPPAAPRKGRVERQVLIIRLRKSATSPALRMVGPHARWPCSDRR